MEESINRLFDSFVELDLGSDIDNVQNENVLYLAYIGDTIFDLFTRDYLLHKYITKFKLNELHKMNTDLVCAKSQAHIVEKLIDDKILTSDEIDFYKHARNAHSSSRSKNSSIVEYRKATGFEALLGLIYYKKDIKRLMTILNNIKKIIDS